MALQHELRVAGARVPELDATVFGSREDPRSIRREGDGEDEVLVAFECLDAAAALRSVVGVATTWSDELPHLNCLVQTSRHEILSIGCKGHGIDGVLVAVWAFETLDKVASSGIPDTDALVERAGSDVLSIWGDGNSGDAVFDAESQYVLAGFDVPEPDGAVATAGSDGSTITSEVQGVDILLMTCESISDASGSNVPDPDQLVFCASSKISSIGAETDTSDVEITDRIDGFILKNADLLSADNIEDLS